MPDLKVEYPAAVDQWDRLINIPGGGKRASEVIIAEAGVDMNVFPTPEQLASWAGMCPAAVAVGHTILVAAWHILSTPDAVHEDLGGDYFTRRIEPVRQQRRLIAQLEALGLSVQVQPAA